MTGSLQGPATAAASLEELFSSGAGGGRAGTGKRVTVLLVDEMDLLVTKKQTVSCMLHFLKMHMAICHSVVNSHSSTPDAA